MCVYVSQRRDKCLYESLNLLLFNKKKKFVKYKTKYYLFSIYFEKALLKNLDPCTLKQLKGTPYGCGELFPIISNPEFFVKYL